MKEQFYISGKCSLISVDSYTYRIEHFRPLYPVPCVSADKLALIKFRRERDDEKKRNNHRRVDAALVGVDVVVVAVDFVVV